MASAVPNDVPKPLPTILGHERRLRSRRHFNEKFMVKAMRKSLNPEEPIKVADVGPTLNEKRKSDDGHLDFAESVEKCTGPGAHCNEEVSLSATLAPPQLRKRQRGEVLTTLFDTFKVAGNVLRDLIAESCTDSRKLDSLQCERTDRRNLGDCGCRWCQYQKNRLGLLSCDVAHEKTSGQNDASCRCRWCAYRKHSVQLKQCDHAKATNACSCRWCHYLKHREEVNVDQRYGQRARAYAECFDGDTQKSLEHFACECRWCNYLQGAQNSCMPCEGDQPRKRRRLAH